MVILELSAIVLDMQDDKYTIESGHLAVGDGHEIYYQRWGNKNAKPIFYMHGGPGSGSKDKYKLNFDPKIHQVIFHDQRGSGQSTPFASTKNNTSQDLVADIEKLRDKFGFNKIQLTGGSWGSTLSLLYAVTHPDKVEKMLIVAIFTGTKVEIDYIQQGGLRTHYPDAWDDFISLVPEKYRHDTGKYFLEIMQKGSQEEIEKHVKAWNRLESSAVSIDSDYSYTSLQAEKYEDSARALAILEAHYFVNNCFLEDNYLLNRADKLSKIQIVMVHGRYDHVCPPEKAYHLKKAIGDNCRLHIVPSSHAGEGGLREAQRAYAWAFLG